MRRSGLVLLVLAALVALGVLCLARDQRSTPPVPASARATPVSAVSPTLSGHTGGPGGAGDAATPRAPAPVAASEPTSAAGSVEGIVTGWDGAPAVGLVVSLVPEDQPVPPRRKGGQWYVGRPPDLSVPRATTDEAGHYVLRGMPREGAFVVVVRVSHTYEVRSAPLRHADIRQRRDVPVPAPATLRVRPALRDGRRLVIRQVDVRGEFVWVATQPDEEVGSWPDDGPPPSDLGADWGLRMEEEGQVASIRTGPGPVTVRVWVDGSPMVERETTLVAGEVHTLELTVPSEGIVRGRLAFPDGWYVHSTTVSWEGDRIVFGEADEDGVFHLSGVGPGKGTLSVEAIGDDLEPLKARLVEVVPDGSPLVVRLERVEPAHLTGALAGVPAGTKVRATILSRRRTGGLYLLVDEHGRFESRIATDEPSLLALRYDNMAPTLVDLPPLAPGERRDLGTLRPVPGVELTGEVRSAEGLAVAGVEVAVAERWADTLYVAPTTSDARGAFRIPHMPLRPLLLRFRGGGFPQHLRRVDPATSPHVEMVLTPGGTADVRVVDAAGSPVPGAWLSVLPVGDFPYDADLDTLRRSVDLPADGRVRLQLCVGPRRLRALSKSGDRSETVEVTIREGETLPVTLLVRERGAK